MSAREPHAGAGARRPKMASAMSGEITSVAALTAQSDRRLAAAIARLGDDSHDTKLALQLVIRGLRLGHVCIDLELARQHHEFDALDGDGASADSDDAQGQPRWPAPPAWRAHLEASPLVAGPGDAHRRPLVLDGMRLYLDRMFRYEARLAASIQARLAAHGIAVAPNQAQSDALLTRINALFGPNLREAQQVAAVDRQRLGATLATQQQLTVIAGGPGTGKTTTVKKLLLVLLAQADQLRGADAHADAHAPAPLVRIALAAPTGKAAARLRESINEGLEELSAPPQHLDQLRALEAMTVHRLLGPRPDSRSRFRHNAEAPLPYDIVVVDEASMIPLSMMAKLFEATPLSSKLILLGDRNQLASVEAGAVLGDICGDRQTHLQLSDASLDALSKLDPELSSALKADPQVEQRVERGIWDAIVTLDRVHRFDEQSGIGQLARALQRSEDPAGAAHQILAQAGPAGRFVNLQSIGCPVAGSPALSTLKSICIDAYAPLVLGARDGRPALELLAGLEQLRILCAHRQGPVGVTAIGAQVEAWLSEQVPGYDAAAQWPLGRPLLIVQNDHEQGLYNGDVGLIVSHPEDPSRHVLALPDASVHGAVRYVSPSRLPRCEPVFAMSIHKSQGSQFRHAVLVLPRKASQICTRELVYTGVTRARERLTIASSEAVLRDALHRTVQRGSGLREILW